MVTIYTHRLNDTSTANDTHFKLLVWTPGSGLTKLHSSHGNLLAFPDNHLKTRNEKAPQSWQWDCSFPRSLRGQKFQSPHCHRNQKGIVKEADWAVWNKLVCITPQWVREGQTEKRRSGTWYHLFLTVVQFIMCVQWRTESEEEALWRCFT
jgi:hypothetical protein